LRPNWSSTSDAAGSSGLLALVAGQQLDDLLTNTVEVGTELDEDLRRDAFTLADQAEQDVLRTDVVVAELQRLAQRELQNLLRARRERDMAARRLLTLTNDFFDLLTHAFERDAERFERLGGDAFAFVNQAEQDVLSADVVVIKHPGFFLSQDDNAPRAVSKPFEHARSSRKRCGEPVGSLHRMLDLGARSSHHSDVPGKSRVHQWGYRIETLISATRIGHPGFQVSQERTGWPN
jgi:hypothetical protein